MRFPLIAFLPIEVLPLVIAIAGLGVVVGLVRPRTALGFVSLFLLTFALAPLLEEFLLSLPWWVSALALLVVGLAIARAVLAWLLGAEGAGHVLGTAFVGLFKLIAWALILPLRALGTLLTHGMRRNP